MGSLVFFRKVGCLPEPGLRIYGTESLLRVYYPHRIVEVLECREWNHLCSWALGAQKGWIRMFRRSAAIAAILFVVSGCGSSNDFSSVSGSSSGNTPPSANMFVQGPPVTGQVTVATSGGQQVAATAATAGHASLTVPESAFGAGGVQTQGASPLVVSFAVEDPTGLGAGNGPATFLAEVTRPTRDDIVGLDVVSTLIALHHRSRPDLSFEQAAEEVFAYLGLPAGTDPEHLFSDTEFDSGLFYEQARAVGGVDALIAEIIAELPQGDDSKGRFLQRNLSSPLNLNSIAKKLSDAALEYVEGEVKQRVVGWLQGVIGIQGDPSIQDVLDAIDGVRQDIARLSDQISRQANIANYNAKDLVLVTQRNDARTDTETLTEWSSPTNLTPPTEDQIAAKMAEIRTRYNSTLATAAELELPRVGSTGQEEPGLAALYLNGAAPRIYSAATKERATYHLLRSLDFQQLVLNLEVEAFHYVRPSLLLDAERAIDTYFANAKSQLQQYPLPFDEDNVLLDRGTGLLWSRRPVIVNDGRTIPGYLRSYTLGGAPAGSWRLPSLQELATLVSATGGTGVDQHTEIGLKREGFLTVNGADQIGDWRIGELNWLVLTNDFRTDSLGAGGTMLHVSNFRSGPSTVVDYDRHSGVSTPYKVAFWVVRNAPEVESISVTEASRTAYSVSYRATARLTDGSSRDITDLVRWSLQTTVGGQVTHDRARISNVSGSDGVLSLRVSNGGPFNVVATYNKVQGTTQSPNLTFASPPVTGLLLSPLRYHVPADGYVTGGKFQLAFHARTVRANGAVADADSEVTWSSSDAGTTVSSSGLVSASRPSVRKVVNITARLGNLSQTSKLVLDP